MAESGDRDVKGMWCSLKNSIMRAAEDVRLGGGSVWWNEEIKKEVKNRREPYRKSRQKNLPGKVKDRIKQQDKTCNIRVK